MFGPDDPRLSDTLELMGFLNEFQARYAKALELFRRGLKMRERFGSSDIAALRLLENSARVQEYLGRYDEAEHSYRTVLTIREKYRAPTIRIDERAHRSGRRICPSGPIS